MSNLQEQREVVKKSRDDLKLQEKSLRSLYDQESQRICPFNIGDTIEYEPGKKGKVDKIYFPDEAWISLEEQEPDLWAVTGLKINKDGKLGKKEYQAVSNKTHIINGTSCRRMNLEETLGIK